MEIERPSDDALVTCSSAVETNQCLDLEHDEHAQVSVLNHAAEDLFASVYNCNEIPRRVVVTAEITARGYLKMGMGEALILPGATRLLISGQELRVKYDMIASGDEIRYTHKVSGATSFGDYFFHCLLDLSSIGVDICASSLGFYDPPPLVPVPPGMESSVWPALR